MHGKKEESTTPQSREDDASESDNLRSGQMRIIESVGLGLFVYLIGTLLLDIQTLPGVAIVAIIVLLSGAAWVAISHLDHEIEYRRNLDRHKS